MSCTFYLFSVSDISPFNLKITWGGLLVIYIFQTLCPRRSPTTFSEANMWLGKCYVNYTDDGMCVVAVLKVIYHPLYSMNNFVTDKSKLPQDGAQVFPYMGW